MLWQIPKHVEAVLELGNGLRLEEFEVHIIKNLDGCDEF